MLNKNQNNEPIKQELSEILAKYYNGSFSRMAATTSTPWDDGGRSGSLVGSDV